MYISVCIVSTTQLGFFSMRENALQALMIKEAKNVNVLCFKIKFIGRRGCPDLILIFPGGRVVFVEVKIPGGSLSTSQKIVLRLLRKWGVPAYDCDNLTKFKKILETHR